MKKQNIELGAGIFVILGMLSLAYLSIRLARMDLFANDGYEVRAVFSNCGALQVGATVSIAGVSIGRVEKISLDDYEALVVMQIEPQIQLQEDSIASIRTKGLIGEKFVEISPGGADELIAAGGKIRDTEPAMDLEGLISKFVQGKL